MMPEHDFNLTRYLHKKTNGEKRITLSLETYDKMLPIITSTLQTALQSPQNKDGFTKFVIFGSWARRDKETGPAVNSDIDLLAYKWGCGLIGPETYRIEVVVRRLMLKAEQENNINLPEAHVEVGIDERDFSNIKSGKMPLTKSGYIIVSA